MKEKLNIKENTIPHILKYMGAKRGIIGFVEEAIDELDVEAEWFCDLFSGTSVVAGTFKDKYHVLANDIQMYSAVFSHTYFSNIKGSISSIDAELDEIIHHANGIRNEFISTYSHLNFKYHPDLTFTDFITLEKNQQNLINKKFDIGFHLFAKYYSGTYWSYEQCIWIDSLRAVAEKYKNNPLYYVILSSLIFAMSYTSQSTGHYAQYRDVTESNLNDILSYRTRDIIPYFKRKFIELTTYVNGSVPKEHLVTTMDYMDCLRVIPNGTIVYADPPYQSVHYSRFYHAIETLVRYDYPQVHYKGRYRDDRHQSPFCLKTKVDFAFTNLFNGVKSRKAHLSLSYADTGMIDMEKIIKLGENVLGNKYTTTILTKDHVHSKMGRSDVKEQNVLEYIINFRRNV